MKKLLSTIVVMLLPMMVCANYNEKYISGSWSHENPDATVDGIHYLLNSLNQTATVTYKEIVYDNLRYWPVNDYSGDIVIPSQVPYGGVDYTVTAIDDGAFDCTYGTHPSTWIPVTSISIPSTVTSIGMGAFKNCASLSSIIIPIGVASISDETFSYCSCLNSVSLPDNLSSIGESAFNNCSGLQSITLPNNLISIGETAFYGCTALTALTIPDNVTTIADGAFQDCTNLTSVTFGYNLSDIGKEAFAGCNKLVNVYCYAPVPPTCNGNQWGGKYDTQNIFNGPTNLDSYYVFVPSSCLDAYKYYIDYVKEGDVYNDEASVGWCYIRSSRFSPLSNSGTSKLATPAITITNGVLTFDCGTNGAEYHYSITYPESNTNTIGNNVQVPQAYVVSVYAVKAGYDKSDTATKQFTITSGVRGDLTNDGEVNVADHVELSKIILGQ